MNSTLHTRIFKLYVVITKSLLQRKGWRVWDHCVCKF